MDTVQNNTQQDLLPSWEELGLLSNVLKDSQDSANEEQDTVSLDPCLLPSLREQSQSLSISRTALPKVSTNSCGTSPLPLPKTTNAHTQTNLSPPPPSAAAAAVETSSRSASFVKHKGNQSKTTTASGSRLRDNKSDENTVPASSLHSKVLSKRKANLFFLS